MSGPEASLLCWPLSLIHSSLRSGLATAGAALCYFVTVGFTSSFGLFQEYYISSVLSTHSAFQIAWIGSFSSFAIFAVAPAAGILADRFGPRVSLRDSPAY